MPELPEMETYRRLLEPRIVQKSILTVEVSREKSLNVTASQFREAVQYQTVTRLERMAKQLIFWLQNDRALVLHLMLGGWMFWGSEDETPKRTVQVMLGFGRERLSLIQLRLGYLHLHDQRGVERIRAKYGPDPFEADFTADRLYDTLSQKRGALKPVLCDQAVLAGIGNCYADEICFVAGIRPTRSCSTLSREECEHLLAAMRSVLQEAVRFGGYMDHPLYQGDTLTGGMTAYLRVYDREGEPCQRCGHEIILETIRSRKTYFCMSCQR